MRNLITGVTGFAGRHLARLLVDADEAVAGYALSAASGDPISGVDLHDGDINDLDRLTEVLRTTRPDVIYHLAAMSHVGLSWSRRESTLAINALGTATLMEAIARTAPGARVLLVSTGQVYGRVPADRMPLTEDQTPRPVNPYAASKLCAEVLVFQAASAGEAHAVVVRPFNFAGPGQAPTFVVSDFARQIARVEHGLAEPRIAVGNLDTRRDFLDVRDVVRGFRDAALRGESGSVFNLAHGDSIRIGDLLEELLSLARTPIRVVTDPERVRPSDTPVFVGDASRAARDLGWRPEIPLRTTLLDTLEYWRLQCAATHSHA